MPIVCPECNHLLEPGIGPTIHKLCIHCVQLKYPGSDMKKIKELHKEQKKITDMDVNNMISEAEAKNLTKKNELIFSIVRRNKKYMANFKVIIPSTGKELELAFDRNQLISFINEIDIVQAEQNKKHKKH